MKFETEFTELNATVGSNKKGNINDTSITMMQWVLIIVIALGLAGGIDLWLQIFGT